MAWAASAILAGAGVFRGAGGAEIAATEPEFKRIWDGETLSRGAALRREHPESEDLKP